MRDNILESIFMGKLFDKIQYYDEKCSLPMLNTVAYVQKIHVRNQHWLLQPLFSLTFYPQLHLVMFIMSLFLLHRMPSRIRQQWSKGEIQALTAAKLLPIGRDDQLPGKEIIEAARADFPILQERPWTKIKDYLRNKQTSYKL
jgi:hypothetical protein